MDKNLEKYRFGLTLQLDPSAYEFGTDTEVVSWVSSICKYAPLYFLQEGVTLIPAGKNKFICQSITSVNIIRLILEAYWDSVNNKCVEFPVI